MPIPTSNSLSSNESKPLIAVSLLSLQNHPFPMATFPRPQQAVIVGESSCQEYCFRFETGPLNEEQSRRCLLLRHHGFTVVEFSDEERWFYRERIRWEEFTIRRALDKVTALCDEPEGKTMSAYDSYLANKVLDLTAKSFPKQVDMLEIKSALDPEPSDHKIFTAIDALEADGFIEAKMLRSGPKNEIQHVAYIRATREGRAHVSGESQKLLSAAQIFHGDQINVHGTVGAVGRDAQGVVNIHQHLDTLGQINLETLAVQLEQLRTEYRRTAVTREDDRQVALLGDGAEAAEKRDGKGVAAILSRAGEGVLKMAKEIGTDVAVKVLVELATGK